MKVVQHLTDNQLRCFSHGEMGLEEFEQAEQHLAECTACCLRLEAEPENTLLSLARAAMTLQGARRSHDATDHRVPGDLLEHPRYRILEPIGSGGMGSVFKAEHRLMQRIVALKLVHPWLLSNTQAIERFEREVRMAARLSHPNIVVAYDADQTDQRHFLVMEYVEGETLQQRVRRDGAVSVELACDWIMQVASGLEHAAEQGMTHRDIKPQNLMITRDGRVRILDFGLSRIATEPNLAKTRDPSAHHNLSRLERTQNPTLTSPSEPGDQDSKNWETNCCSIARTDASLILGTPDYIAPEQIDSSASVDVRADIYSLGCTLYYLLTGKPPFHTTNIAETLHSQRYAPLPDVREIRTDIPDSLVHILAKMTAKHVEDRYHTPREVRQALEDAIVRLPGNPPRGAGVDDGPPVNPMAAIGPATANQPQVRSRRKLFIAGAIALLLMLMLMAGVALWVIPAKSVRLLVALPADGLWYPDYEELVKASQKLAPRVQVVFAGTEPRPSNVLSTSKPGIAVPDVLVSDQLHAKDFDGMIFLGYLTQEFSPQSGPIGEETARLVREFQLQKKVLGSVCAGQRILAQHGALRGKQVAPCESVRDEEIVLEGGTRSTAPIVADGLVVTASSAEYAENFLKKLIEVGNH